MLRTSPAVNFGSAHGCARLFHRSFRKHIGIAERVMGTTAGEWSFGLCATRSREPRQARKGATVPGTPWAPQTTRSSSHRQPARVVIFVVVHKVPASHAETRQQNAGCQELGTKSFRYSRSVTS